MNASPPRFPSVISLNDRAPNWDEWRGERGAAVTKIVLGKIDKDGAKNPLLLGSLPDDFAAIFLNLKRLHLWNCAGFTTLPALPAGLTGLDLRGCTDLISLPELPAGLDTLDLARCGALTHFEHCPLLNLRSLHIDDCEGIAPDDFNVFLKRCTALETFTAEACRQFQSFQFPRQERTPPPPPPVEAGPVHPLFPERRLRKVVLRGCAGLTRLPDLSAYPWLHHLDVNDCASLESLPALPVGELADGTATGIRTVYTHECARLRSYLGFDLRAVHRSQAPNQNVADGLRVMHHLASEPETLAMAKVLFLGSGRCGKTTLSKALQWSTLDEEGKKERPELNPRQWHESTHAIRFAPWRTEFELADRSRMPGTMHLWDFGGQELYHDTHRLFASEGAVFVIVTTSPELHQERLKRELAKERDEEKRAVYRKQNEYRELKYWLDYLRNALGLKKIDDLAESAHHASILVVHAGPGGRDEAKRYLLEQAGPYRELVEKGRLRLCGWNVEADGNQNLAEIISWILSEGGRVADDMGIQVPRSYAEVARLCESKLKTVGHDPRPLDWKAWVAFVGETLPEIMQTPSRREEFARAVSRHLHNCGVVFELRRHHQVRQVVLDHQWMASRIYLLTVHAMAEADLREPLLRLTRDLFDADALREILRRRPELMDIANRDLHWELTLDLLNQCNVCVKTGERWMAVQRELLGSSDELLDRELSLAWTDLTREPLGHWINTSFALHGDHGGILGASDYRTVLAAIVRGLGDAVPKQLFGPGADEIDHQRGAGEFMGHYGRPFEHRCWFWQDGFMLQLRRKPKPNEPDDPGEALMLRVEWQACAIPGNPSARSFEGGLFVQLLSTDEENYAGRLRELLFGENGPLVLFKEHHREHDHRPPDLADEVLPSLRGLGQPGWTRRQDGPRRRGFPFDVGISYRGTQTALVMQMAKVLRAENLQVCHYNEDHRLSDKRDDPEHPGGSYITDIYDDLRDARILLVVASEDYFADPIDAEGKRRNCYCPVELAEAVTACAGLRPGGARPPFAFLWVAGKDAVSPGLVPDAFKRVLKAYWTSVAKPRIPSDEWDEQLPAIDKRENDSLAACGPQTRQTEFLDAIGRDKKQYVSVWNRDVGDYDWSEFSRRIRGALSLLDLSPR